MTEQQPNKGFQYQVWIMLLMVAGVMLAGFLLMPADEAQRQELIEFLGTTNQGALVKPAVDLSPVLVDIPGNAGNSKWRVLIVSGDICDAACEKVIHDTHQVHVRSGKLANRLERVLIPPPTGWSAEVEAQMRQDNPYLQIRALDRARLRELLSQSNAIWDMLEVRYFVVTPDNRAILYYDPAQDPVGLLEDIKHLLKYSPDR